MFAVTGSLAVYVLGLAVTGSGELRLSPRCSCFCWRRTRRSGSVRRVAMFALAAAAAAVRLRSQRWFIAAGALAVVAWLFSVDFALYSAVVILFAAFRMRALRAVAIGIAAAAVPLLLLFAAFGFAGDFLRVTFVELPSTHSAYFRQLSPFRTAPLPRHPSPPDQRRGGLPGRLGRRADRRVRGDSAVAVPLAARRRGVAGRDLDGGCGRVMGGAGQRLLPLRDDAVPRRRALSAGASCACGRGDAHDRGRATRATVPACDRSPSPSCTR